ncbi:regulator of microtubule dynamics protein 3 isoform X5 [Pelodiscus sinensis]|uniref:regulator of microtubule dynamics protein 3 isoform X5 n=1 Tax=Pelodiscus sinensis TaxID=13735 RepID=UPI003F6A953A
MTSAPAEGTQQLAPALAGVVRSARPRTQHSTRHMMSKLRVSRAGLGLLLGAAAGIGFLYVFYKQRRKQPWWGRGSRDSRVQRMQNSVGPHETAESLAHNQVLLIRQAPLEAGDGITYTSLLTREEQVEVLNRLDFVLKNIIDLRREVEELKNSLQSLAGEIIGEVRSHLEEAQKVSRRRRYMFPRERSDSTGSSSIYFTASSGTANTDDGESEGGRTSCTCRAHHPARDSLPHPRTQQVHCNTAGVPRPAAGGPVSPAPHPGAVGAGRTGVPVGAACPGSCHLCPSADPGAERAASCCCSACCLLSSRSSSHSFSPSRLSLHTLLSNPPGTLRPLHMPCWETLGPAGPSTPELPLPLVPLASPFQLSPPSFSPPLSSPLSHLLSPVSPEFRTPPPSFVK